jgi:hypothetical protein
LACGERVIVIVVLIFTAVIAIPAIPMTTTMPSLSYPAGTPIITKDFNWKYNNKNYKWQAEIPSNLVSWDQQVATTVSEYYSGNSSQQAYRVSLPKNMLALVEAWSSKSKGNISSWAFEDTNNQFITYIAQQLNQQAINDRLNQNQKVEFVQSFVGGAVPYQLDTNYQLAALTLASAGKCDDKSFLTANILADMGYKVALLDYSAQRHMAVGVVVNEVVPSTATSPATVFSFNGSNYYYLETTSSGWKIGQANDTVRGAKPGIYPVN